MLNVMDCRTGFKVDFWREDALACTPDECHGYAEKRGYAIAYSVFTTRA